MEKSKVNGLKENISEILELPKDIILDLPRITVLGNLELRIENHKGIIEYSNEKIRIKIKNGILKLIGTNLLIKTIISEEIIVTGNIFSIDFDNRGV